MEKQYVFCDLNSDVIDGTTFTFVGTIKKHSKLISKYGREFLIDLSNKELIKDLLEDKLIEEKVSPEKEEEKTKTNHSLNTNRVVSEESLKKAVDSLREFSASSTILDDIKEGELIKCIGKNIEGYQFMKALGDKILMKPVIKDNVSNGLSLTNLYIRLGDLKSTYNESTLLESMNCSIVLVFGNSNTNTKHISLHLIGNYKDKALCGTFFDIRDKTTERTAVSYLVKYLEDVETLRGVINDIKKSGIMNGKEYSHTKTNIQEGLLDTYKGNYITTSNYEKDFGLLRYALMQEALKADAKYKQNIRTVDPIWVFDFDFWNITDYSKSELGTKYKLNYNVVPAFRTKEDLIEAIKNLRPLFHEFKPRNDRKSKDKEYNSKGV